MNGFNLLNVVYKRKLNSTLLAWVSMALLFVSCSQFNTESKDHYNDTKPFRHGSMKALGNVEYVAKKAEPISEESAQRGKSLYQNYCISCHGASGKGDGPGAKGLEKTPKDLAKLARNVANLKYYMVRSHSESSMPGWKPFFTNRNIVDIEHYIRSFSSKIQK